MCSLSNASLMNKKLNYSFAYVPNDLLVTAKEEIPHGYVYIMRSKMWKGYGGNIISIN